MRKAAPHFVLLVLIGISCSGELADGQTRARFFPAEFRSQAGPTPSFSYLTPSIIALETNSVPGTPSGQLYFPEGKRIWDIHTGELIYGDLLDPEEFSALAYSPTRDAVVFQDTSNEIALIELSESAVATRYPTGMGTRNSNFVPGTELLIVDGFKSPNWATLCLDLSSGELQWQSELFQRSFTYFIAASNRYIEHRLSYSTSAVVRSLNATTGEIVGEIEASQSTIRKYQSISPFDQVEKIYSIGTSQTESLVLNAITGDSFTLEEDASERNHLYSLSYDAKTLAVFYPTSNRFELRSATDGSLLFDINAARSGQGYTAQVRWFGFSPDNTRILIVDGDGSLTEWSTSSMQLLRTILGTSNTITAFAQSPDGLHLVTANSLTPKIEVRSIATGAIVGEISLKNPVRQIAVAPDSSSITILVGGGVAHSYAMPHCSLIGSVPDDQGLAYLSSAVTSRNSFISYYHNGTVEERSADDFKLIGTYEFLRRLNEAYAIDPRTGYILFFDVFAQIALFDPFTNEDVQSFNTLDRVEFASIATSSEGETLIALSGTKLSENERLERIFIHSTESPDPIETIELEDSANRIELAPDASKLAFVTSNSSFSQSEPALNIKPLGSDAAISTQTLEGTINDLVFTSDSNKLYVLWHGNDQELRISRHNADTGERVEDIDFASGRVEPRSSPLGVISLFPDESRALVATAQSDLIAVDLLTGSILARQRTRQDRTGFGSSSEALRMASISENGKRILYQDAQGLQDSWFLSLGQSHPLALTLSADGPRFSIETSSGETYLLELSRELSKWSVIQEMKPEKDERLEFELPLEGERTAFVRAFKFSSN